MAAQKATSYDEVKEILQYKAENNISRDKVLVTARSVKTDYKIRKGKDLATRTVRNYGICQDGYFLKAYSDVFSYQKEGDPMYWGLVMKPEPYLRVVTEMSEEKIEELKEKAENEED